MRDKASVKKVAPQEWLATRPGYGLNPPEHKTLGSQHAALAWLTTCHGRGGSSDNDLSYQLHDAIGSVPMWEPYQRPPYDRADGGERP